MQSIGALVQVSEGDLRKAITFLQGAARLSVDKEITERTITEIAGVRPCDGRAWTTQVGNPALIPSVMLLFLFCFLLFLGRPPKDHRQLAGDLL